MDDAWSAWQTLTTAADPWLDALSAETLLSYGARDGKPTGYRFGSLLLRNIYHYWYHTGENMAIRQNLGHGSLPEFVGNLDAAAPYRPDR